MEKEIVEALDKVGPITVCVALENEFRRAKDELEESLQEYNWDDHNWRMLCDQLLTWKHMHDKVIDLENAITTINPDFEAQHALAELEDIPF
jgi:hypothetical protein